MKSLFYIILFVILFTINFDLAFGDLEIGTRLLPSKLVENSEGILQIYLKENGIIVPEKIQGLTITSLDSSIVKVDGVENDPGDHVIDVYLKSYDSGSTKLLLAANGFSGQEIPMTIYDSKQTPTGILINVIPESFSLDTLREGFISVTLVDNFGLPVVAKKDIVIHLSTTNDKIIDIPQKDILVKKGEYFAFIEFEVVADGTATIYAFAEGLDSANTDILVNKSNEYEITLYVLPNVLNTQSSSVTYFVAQLQNGGVPVIAQEDVIVILQVSNQDISENINSNDSRYTEINKKVYFVIEKGRYWGIASFTPPVSTADTYDVTISTTNPLSVDTGTVTTLISEQVDNGFIEYESLPILATGNRELIGVMHLEDENGFPRTTSKDLTVKIDSSDESFLSVEPVVFSAGSSSALVYGKVGTVVPNNLELYSVFIESGMITPTVYGMTKDSLSLIAEPLTPKIITGTNFPTAIYLESGDVISSYTDNNNIFASPSEFFKIHPKTFDNDEGIILLDTASTREGMEKLEIFVGEFTVSTTLEGLSGSVSKLQIDATETIFSGQNDVFSIQLLDTSGNPVFADKNMEISLIPKDPDLIQIPNHITIEKGKHFVLFDVSPLHAGTTEIVAMIEGLPLEIFEITITTLSPTVEIDAPDEVLENESFLATISVSHEGKTLSDLDIKWHVDGGMIQLSDTTTNHEGKAVASILPQSHDNVSLQAEITSSWYSSADISKNIKVNIPTPHFSANVTGIDESRTKFEKPTIGGIDPILLVVPAVLGILGYKFKKRKKS